MEQIYILDLNSKCLILKKEIISDRFFNIICNGIFLLFSFEINRPRILINENYVIPKFKEKLEENCEVKNIKIYDFEKFENFVHFGEFDLGIIIENSKDNLIIKFISGSGKKLSSEKFSVFENYLKNNRNLINYYENNGKINEKLKKYNLKHKINKQILNLQIKQQKQKLNNFISSYK